MRIKVMLALHCCHSMKADLFGSLKQAVSYRVAIRSMSYGALLRILLGTRAIT